MIPRVGGRQFRDRFYVLELPNRVNSDLLEGFPDDLKTSTLISKAIDVLESKTVFRTALASNINAFHLSIDMTRRQDNTDAPIEALEKRVNGLEAENEDLKKRLEERGDATSITDESNTGSEAM